MSKLSEPITSADHIAGNPQASVTLVEYGDYQCPYCGQAHPIVKQILARFGNDIRFVFRNFPLTEIHPHAFHAATAAEFANLHGKFWEMHDTIYENQQALKDSDLSAYGHRLGLDPVDLVEGLDDPNLEGRVQHDFMTGVRSGVNGTPSFFIDGVRHDGAWDFEHLSKALQAVIR